MSLSLQIKSLAEQGASVSDIATVLELSKEAVEYELARIGKIEEEDIPEEDFKIIRQNLIEIAKDPGADIAEKTLSAKVGMFLYDHVRGTAKSRHAPPINIAQINTLILQAHERIKSNLSRPGTVKVNSGQGPTNPATDQNPAGSQPTDASAGTSQTQH